jgi:hypothetical protein
VTRPSLDQLLWRCFVEAQALLRQAERIEINRYEHLAAHLLPLSQAVEAIEDFEQKCAEREDAAARRMGFL